MRVYDSTSQVELHLLEKNQHKPRYSPTEKVDAFEVIDFPTLGKFTALRFLEWLQKNPEGVVALPTGKTPEYFIKWTCYYLHNWYDLATQNELKQWGLNPALKPDMHGFTFVQIDEFYPMNPAQENSFASYIKRFYFKDCGFDQDKALLMDTWSLGVAQGKKLGDIFQDGRVDISLRVRQPINQRELLQAQALVAADEYAMAYEAKIKALGGIGFFLGGIGSDGHIGFNVRGSDHYSTTRLMAINYETAASAAVDLGGIEQARQRAVITIGLRTITRNPTATVIIIAAGEGKAQIIKNAVEKAPSVLYPATVLHSLPGARFYLTEGASLLLIERKFRKLASYAEIPEILHDEVIIDVACKNNKPLNLLTQQELEKDLLGALVARNFVCDAKTLGQKTHDKIVTRIKAGINPLSGYTFLHTAPHHDDIMLGYLPYVVHLVRESSNKHFFATLTSGFTSVSNQYALVLLNRVKKWLPWFIEHKIILKRTSIERNIDLYEYLDAVALRDICAQQLVHSRRLISYIMELYHSSDLVIIEQKVDELISYFTNCYPGKKDTIEVQTFKGMIREWEEELLWAHLGFDSNHTFHLRLGFYTGDIFTPQPELERDMIPIFNLLEKTSPDIVTVAMDPEASGPDTHYKVLLGIAGALKLYMEKYPDKKVKVWGYRNVWYRFHPAHTNIFVPVSMNSFAILSNAFNTCFGSQREASFPSHEYDGPFSDLAQKIMVEQYMMLKTCLGADYFHNNQSPRLRAAHGFCFLKEMTTDEFFAQTQELKMLMETA